MGNIFQNLINLFRRQEHRVSNYPIKSVDYSKYYHIDGNITEEFYSNLRTTIAWTESIISKIENPSNIDYIKILRSTNPIYEGKPFYFYYGDYNSASTPKVGFN